MPLFIIFVFGAVILGAGAMLSPALPARQPRIGVAATLALALIIGGAIFWQELFGADMLVIDYVLFALVSFVVLGGTLSQAQTRAEAKGEELPDRDQGWTGPQDLAFFGLVGLLLLVLVRLATPVGMDGVFSPGYELLTAYLGQQLNQSRPAIQASMAAVITLVSIWAMYDLGSELRDKRLGRTMALALLPVILAIFAGGYFTVLMGLAFITAFLLFIMRVIRHTLWQDTLTAGLTLGATLYASVPAFLVALIVILPWMITVQSSGYVADTRPAANLTRRLPALVGIPLIAMAGTLPWLVNQRRSLTVYLAGFDTAVWMILTLSLATGGGFVLLWLWDRLVPDTVRSLLYRQYYVLAGLMAAALTGFWLAAR